MRMIRGLITKLALPLAMLLILSVFAFAAKNVTKYGYVAMGDAGATLEAEDGNTYTLVGAEGGAEDDDIMLKGELMDDGKPINVQSLEKTERQPGGPTY